MCEKTFHVETHRKSISHKNISNKKKEDQVLQSNVFLQLDKTTLRRFW